MPSGPSSSPLGGLASIDAPPTTTAVVSYTPRSRFLFPAPTEWQRCCMPSYVARKMAARDKALALKVDAAAAAEAAAAAAAAAVMETTPTTPRGTPLTPRSLARSSSASGGLTPRPNSARVLGGDPGLPAAARLPGPDPANEGLRETVLSASSSSPATIDAGRRQRPALSRSPPPAVFSPALQAGVSVEKQLPTRAPPGFADATSSSHAPPSRTRRFLTLNNNSQLKGASLVVR